MINYYYYYLSISKLFPYVLPEKVTNSKKLILTWGSLTEQVS